MEIDNTQFPDQTEPSQPGPWIRFRAWLGRLKIKLWGDRKRKIRTSLITGLVALLIAFGWVVYSRYFQGEISGDITLSGILSPAKTKTAVSPLSGLSYPEDKTQRHPMGVVIENHPDARPQSGLDKAEIVYEAITEGGITRFLAIFGPRDAEEIGPVRSARTFFVTWVQEYDAYFAHAGGSKDGLEQIAADNIQDLPHTTGYFERQPQAGIATEHTLYTSLANLYELAKAKKFDQKASFTALKFKDEATETERGNQEKVAIPFSNDTYTVDWLYNKGENNYQRLLAGVAHKDKKSGTQITAKNIIIQTVERAAIELPGAKPTFRFTTEGSGKAIVIMDGRATEGTWKKSAKRERTKFYDSSGAEIKFNRGIFWYEIVPPEITPIIKTNDSAN